MKINNSIEKEVFNIRTEKFLIISKKEKDGYFEYGIRNKRRKVFLINDTNEFPVGNYVFVEYVYKQGLYLDMKIL
jgi:hypothetical protein